MKEQAPEPSSQIPGKHPLIEAVNEAEDPNIHTTELQYLPQALEQEDNPMSQEDEPTLLGQGDHIDGLSTEQIEVCKKPSI